jgi:hypothetical protein
MHMASLSSFIRKLQPLQPFQIKRDRKVMCIVKKEREKGCPSGQEKIAGNGLPVS